MAREIRIVPALLTDNANTLAEMIHTAEKFTNYVQIDMMDGEFVPTHRISAFNVAAVGSPVRWEAHIMVLHPEEYFDGLKIAGASRVIFHYEATKSPQEVIKAARKLGLGVGLAVNPETKVKEFLALTGEVDNVLLLAVNPGYYGARFIPEVLDKIKELRKARPRLEIGIDGGIKEGNIADTARTGVDVICIGSAILTAQDPPATYHRLLEIAQNAVKDKTS